MALSFEESKRLMAQQLKKSVVATPVSMADDYGIATLDASIAIEPIAAYSEWTKSDKYDWYDEYSDDKVSTVDNNKNITVDPSQINISQEENSQFIPFEMSRYYDGFDLMSTELWFFYKSSDGVVGSTRAINVSYDTATIKFGWLVDGQATHISGKLSFEIRAIGVNSMGKPYTWKTQPFDKLNVIQSLIDDKVIKVDDSWMQELVANVTESVTEKIANMQVAEQIAIAEAAATRAENAASQAESAVATKLGNYYTKTEVNNAIADARVDLTGYATEDYVQDRIAEIPEVDLTGYATEDYVRDQIDAIPEVDLSNHALKSEIPTAVSELENDAGYLTEHQSLDNYVTQQGMQDAIDAIDVTDQLENYALKTYVDDAVAAVDVSDQLVDYALKTYVDDAVAAVDVSSQLVEYAKSSDVYTKTEVDNKDSALSSSISANTTNITSLSTTVGELQNAVNSFDTSPRLTYDVKYNDTEDADVGENVFAFYEITNEGQENETREIKQKFTIVGGGGGGATSSTLKIGYVTTSPLVITTNDSAVIKYTFSGTDSSGDDVTEGTATWKIAGTVIATNMAVAGENSFDITDYLSVGTQKVNLTIVDDAGSLVSKNWTVQKIDVRLESTFNDRLTYPIGAVSFTYTPYGAISKDIHFVLDGDEIGTVNTSSSGIPMVYEIPVQNHGAHLLEVYMTAEVNGNDIESNHIVKDIIWYDPDSRVPVIGTAKQKFTARQYDSTNIEYVVYDPTTETPAVEIAVDGVVVSTPTLTSVSNVYTFKTDVIGSHTITITCGETVKVLEANITKLDINVTPVTAGLVFDFNPSGKSNNDTDRIWTNGTVSMSVSDNFDWVNGGYQYDENGDQYFCVKAGTTAIIDHNMFADDAKVNGKEFKVVFKTTNIKKRDTSFISCMNNNIGLDMKVESANVYSSNGNLYSPYCEEDIIEFEFNINKNTDIPMVLTYEDGVANRPMIYTSDSSFWQADPQPITIGSDYCDVHIYRMKAYSNSLTDSNILANFIADARNADEMVSRYDRNQIYDENNLLDPEVLATKCPNLRILMIDAPWFTNDKDNKVEDTTVRMIYKNGDAILDNWTCTGAQHSGQGTSSNEYGYAGRNIDLIMDTDTSLFKLGDGSESKTITLTRNSVPTDYLNVKVNIASSENQNNAQMAKRYNDYNPFIRSAKFNDPKVKDTMEFYNCVIFIKERNEDIATHREFLDCNYHFYAIGNVGDSKKTDDTRVNDKSDPKECVIEIADYNVALAEFPTGNPDGICAPADWKAGNKAYDDLYAAYKYKDGKFKSFGNGSYEFRYEKKGITEEQRQSNIDAWRDAYRFIVTSTDEEFHSRLKEYFVVDSVLYFYLFTERYTMVDNRAKNSFWHYGKVYITSEEAATLGAAAGGFVVDDVQAAINDGYRWDLSFGYDFDTSLGIDNTGKLVLTYGKEDADYYVDGDPSSSYIYRAAESTFFCRLRDLFNSEMQAMFVDRENANAWSAHGLITQWDNAQSQFPEELWRLNIQREYMRTYQGISLDNSISGTANPRFLTEMLNGRKKYQRRMFERNQELYMATKYFGKVATQDQIMMRFNNPETYVVKPDFTLYLTPYSDMYIGVSFYNGHKDNFRAKAGVKYTIPYPEGIETADITLIYGASFIQAIDDLSKCYIGDNDFSKASRLQSLVIGSDVEGYANTYMKKISLGNNKLLEYLDIRNITGLDSVVDLSNCGNLLELYAQGSGATGVIFANGGKIERFYIPSVTSLTMKNLNYIEDFSIESYNNLMTLIVENISVIDTREIVSTAAKLQTLRLVGLNWNLDDTTVLDKALTFRGVNNDGGEIAQSVLIGRANVPVVRQQQLYEYQNAWSDLEVVADTIIEQFAVTFMNADGNVIEVQYVDKGSNAVDPTTRIDNPIIPTIASTVQYDYTFTGWDAPLTSVFSDRTINALYSESLRSYTIKYVSKGTTMQESIGLYGENIPYIGIAPTYTVEESGYVYHLFNRWDKSGFIDGDKTVNAIFDRFEYTATSFDGKSLKDLSPVEIYAMNKLGLAESVITNKDPYTIVVGNDVEYDDIESELLISEKTAFDGSNYLDTGVQLFDQDRDFVLAIDYELLSGNKSNSVLAQCFQVNGTNGFKLWYSTANDFNGVKLTWGTTADNVVAANQREIIIIRHKKGDNNLMIYKSNLDGNAVLSVDLTRNKATIGNGTLVFGAARADDGIYENHAIGNIYWSKVWYADLGDDVCRSLAMWTHESITLEACGFRKYYLSDNTSKRCSFSLLASHLLGRTKRWNAANLNTGGWAQSELNTSLNTRLYNAMPTQIRELMKNVIVYSSVGQMSPELSSSNCYITIPALIEVDPTQTSEPYNSEGTSISYLSTNTSRKRAFDGGDYSAYWLRSPNVGYANYIWRVDENGATQGITNAQTALGVLIEISF